MAMKINAVRIISAFLAVSLIAELPLVEIAVASQDPSPPVVAVMPFETHGLSEDESGLLRTEFLKELRSSGRFSVMSDDSMWSILKEANMTNLEQCTYSHCIAEVGKVLGVERVYHFSATRRGKLYTMRARVISSSTSDILLDRAKEHSGEFEPLLTSAIPDMVREMQEAKPSQWQKYKWYVVGGVVLALGTAIYFINRSLIRSSASDVPSQPEPGPSN